MTLGHNELPRITSVTDTIQGIRQKKTISPSEAAELAGKLITSMRRGKTGALASHHPNESRRDYTKTVDVILVWSLKVENYIL